MASAKLQLNPGFLTDASGQRVGVMLDMDDYLQVVEALEDMIDQADFDIAITAHGDAIPFEQAVAEIGRDWPTT